MPGPEQRVEEDNPAPASRTWELNGHCVLLSWLLRDILLRAWPLTFYFTLLSSCRRHKYAHDRTHANFMQNCVLLCQWFGGLSPCADSLLPSPHGTSLASRLGSCILLPQLAAAFHESVNIYFNCSLKEQQILLGFGRKN